MKNLSILSFILLVVIFAGCGDGGPQGELVGVGGQTDWYEPDPYGMVFIPSGSYTMGTNDRDISFAYTAPKKTVSIDPFWMDATEITNSEYKQFVFWVRDSIARRYLVGADFEQYKKEVDEERIEAIDPTYDHSDTAKCLLNWEEPIEWKSEDPEILAALSSIYVSKKEQFFNQREIDAHKLIYEFEWVDLKQAAKKSNRYSFDANFTGGKYSGKVINAKGKPVTITDRSSFVMRSKIDVYPDTLVWMADYSYSFNEPLTRMYFWHTAYNNYPVVGVNWLQANAFSIWRTQIQRTYQASIGEPTFQDYRLPTESEWEYAARGGLDLSKYPWGGPYTRNKLGCFIANFKPLRGNYGDDGANRTMEVMRFSPNEFGLYDMAGNVAEWTSDAFDESAYSFTHDLNPDYRYHATDEDPAALRRKVIRGGSWKDVAFFLQVGVRTYEYQDTSKSYVGFRCVRSFMGNDATDWDAENFDKP